MTQSLTAACVRAGCLHCLAFHKQQTDGTVGHCHFAGCECQKFVSEEQAERMLAAQQDERSARFSGGFDWGSNEAVTLPPKPSPSKVLHEQMAGRQLRTFGDVGQCWCSSINVDQKIECVKEWMLQLTDEQRERVVGKR